MNHESRPAIKVYPPLEEKINIGSHLFGLVLSVLGLVALVIRASASQSERTIFAAMLFGLSLVCLYAASVLYHHATEPRVRIRRRVYDHASIYLLIAGTYTPFALISLDPETGRTLFLVAWGLALGGVILKLFFTGRFSLLSTLMYVAMGWMVIFVIEDFIEALSFAALTWLAAGGIAYTVGAVLYSIKRIPFHHALFHVFVVVGSICHFVSVYFFVLAA